MRAFFLIARQAQVAEAKDGAIAVGGQRDLHRRRAWWHRIVLLPAPRHYDPIWRIDLSELAQRKVFAVDVDTHAPTRPRIQLGADPHPLVELRRVDQIGEDRRLECGVPLYDLAPT